MVVVHAIRGWSFTSTYRTDCVPAATLIAGLLDRLRGPFLSAAGWTMASMSPLLSFYRVNIGDLSQLLNWLLFCRVSRDRAAIRALQGATHCIQCMYVHLFLAQSTCCFPLPSPWFTSERVRQRRTSPDRQRPNQSGPAYGPLCTVWRRIFSVLQPQGSLINRDVSNLSFLLARPTNCQPDNSKPQWPCASPRSWHPRDVPSFQSKVSWTSMGAIMPSLLRTPYGVGS